MQKKGGIRKVDSPERGDGQPLDFEQAKLYRSSNTAVKDFLANSIDRDSTQSDGEHMDHGKPTRTSTRTDVKRRKKEKQERKKKLEIDEITKSNKRSFFVTWDI